MIIEERVLKEKLAAELLIAVIAFHSPEIAVSVIDFYGDFHNMSRRELEEMSDDLVSKLNDDD